jgi:hypothetical protein
VVVGACGEAICAAGSGWRKLKAEAGAGGGAICAAGSGWRKLGPCEVSVGGVRPGARGAPKAAPSGE